MMGTSEIRIGSLRYVSSEVERMVTELDLGEQHSQMAHQIFKQTIKSEYEFPSYDAVVPAVVYLTDRVIGPELTLGDVADVARRDLQYIQTVAESINSELGLPIKLQTPENLLMNRLDNLSLGDYQTEFKRLLGAVEDSYKGSHSPASVAAALTYLGTKIFDLDLKQQDISDEFGVTKVTIRKRYPEIIERSTISPPRGERRFRNFDKALSVLGDDLGISEETLKRAKARVTLVEPDLAVSVNKAGIVLAAIAETVAQDGGPTRLADNAKLADYAAVSEPTIEKHRRLFEGQ